MMKEIASEFEALNDIHFILRVIDGSYKSILASFHDPIPYYNKKKLYLCWLQGVVDADYKFWD